MGACRGRFTTGKFRSVKNPRALIEVVSGFSCSEDFKETNTMSEFEDEPFVRELIDAYNELYLAANVIELLRDTSVNPTGTRRRSLGELITS